jgi:hypothetical protein
MFLNVRDQVSKPYKTTVFHILIFTFFGSRHEDMNLMVAGIP